jgi:alkanesulfonate monooxygenase SsuD/methylene tetrahydromethanopterin reductase-like flavin-dependent oxidoreductase (luciferase family)
MAVCGDEAVRTRTVEQLVTPTLRFGIPVYRSAPARMHRQAEWAATVGLDSLWMADHMTGFPDDQPVFDPFVTLAALSASAPGLALGVAATDPFRRHPAVLAQAVATLAAFSGQEVLLGIGAGEAMNLDPYGIPHDRPLARLRQGIEAMRLLGGSSVDAPVDSDGELFPLRKAFLQRGEAPPPRFLLATNGPKGRDLAGEVGDGWLPIMLTPELLAEDSARILRVARDAGRDTSAFEVAYHVFFALDEDRERALDAVTDATANVLLGFPQLAARMGVELPSDFDWGHLQLTADTAALVAEAGRAVPRDLVARLSIAGTVEDCIARMEEYADAGVTHFILRTFGSQRALTDVLRDRVLPHFRAGR